jgi:quercetin dioxygenase-like cupin family protein
MKHSKIDTAPKFYPVKGAEMTLIGNGEKMTLIRIFCKPGTTFPEHEHPNEQIGTCVEGQGLLTSGGEELQVSKGVTWTIPAGELHEFKVKGEAPVIIYEAWSPRREDYLSQIEKKT